MEAELTPRPLLLEFYDEDVQVLSMFPEELSNSFPTHTPTVILSTAIWGNYRVAAALVIIAPPLHGRSTTLPVLYFEICFVLVKVLFVKVRMDTPPFGGLRYYPM